MREAYQKLTEAVASPTPCSEDVHSGALVWEMFDGGTLLVNDPLSHRLLAGEAATGWLLGTEDHLGYPTGEQVAVPTFRGAVAAVRRWLNGGTLAAPAWEPWTGAVR